MMTTNAFEVAFKFDGRLADQGMLDGSDHETAIAASRRLLALHAHSFLHGKVPRAALSDGSGYHVVHVATRKGSHEDVWQIILNSQWTVQIMGGMVGGALANILTDAVRVVRDSLKAAIATGPRHLPEFRRVEPVLQMDDGNREPIVDLGQEQDAERRKLRTVVAQVLLDTARPVGRSASRLTITVEREIVAVIDEETKQRWLADQITEAVRGMRNESAPHGRARAGLV